MDQHDEHEQRHREKVHDTCAFITAEKRGQLLHLHRLPDREAGQYQHQRAQDDREIGRPLRGVVHGQILVREPAAQRFPHVLEYRARRERQELPPEVTRDDAVGHVDDAVQHQQPQGGKVPLQGTRKPAAEGELAGNPEREEGRRVVDAPAARHHDEDRKHVDPVRDAHGERVDLHPIRSALLRCLHGTSSLARPETGRLHLTAIVADRLRRNRQAASGIPARARSP
jgi:hypothetical protein